MLKFRLTSITCIILFLCITFTSNASEPLSRTYSDTSENVLASNYFDLIIRYSSHDKMTDNPMPSEGVMEFEDWLSENFFVPKTLRNRLELKPIRILFLVSGKGELSGFKVLEDAGYGTGELMIDLLKKSANWLPVRKNKKLTNVEVEISVILIPRRNSFWGLKGGSITTEGKWGEKDVLKESTVKPAYNNSDPDATIYESVEIYPEPPGGMATFRTWIGDNYKYPQAAIDEGLKGTIQVSFIVEKDGSLTDIKVLKDMSYGTGQAAINLMKSSKKWSPGIQNGQPVRVHFTLPIKIDLSDM